MPFALPATSPADLSVPATISSLFTRSGFRWDYAIGGLPFLSGADPNNPIVRESAPIKKQQFDITNTPGEQSLGSWWLRSQASFHGGAGQNYVDPTGYSGFNIDATSLTRFKASRNVCVWEPGKLTLLHAVNPVTGGGGLLDATEFTYGDGTDAVFGAKGAAGWWYYRVSNTTGIGTMAKPVLSVASDGSHLYAATADGVYSTPIPATAGILGAWTREYTIPAPDKPVRIDVVKQRIMLGVGADVFELAPHPATTPAALPTSRYTAPDPNWQWRGFTESGSAIYAVGNNNVRGSIVKFVLDSAGGVPVLSSAVSAAQLPAGEVPYSAAAYLGAYVGVGTSRGVRIATADSNGDLTYGPLLFSTTQPVTSWTARDRFLFCAVTAGVDGDSGVYRIDLSNQVADMVFPYATDVNAAGDGSPCAVVASLGASGRLFFSTTNSGYLEDATVLASSGYLLTSRIRFGTLEPKVFRYVKVRGPSLVGSVSVTVFDQGDHESASFVYGAGTSPGDTEPMISSPSGAQDFISLKFTLTSGGSGGPEVWGYQLKALPGGTRQRMVQLPLLIFDWERDSRGNRRGGKGSALARLRDLEGLERVSFATTLQDFNAATTQPVIIEQISFKQTSPPMYAEGFGGIATVTLRTV